MTDKPHSVRLRTRGWIGWRDLAPIAVRAAIEPVDGRHRVTIWYHPAVTTQTRVAHDQRLFAVVAVQPDPHAVELQLLCEEVTVRSES
jgi:head-tail adaptor